MRSICLVVVLCIAVSTSAQEKPKNDTTKHRYTMTKQPFLALGLSAALPGAGQIYNEQWWKVPLIAAGFGGCIYAGILQNGRMIDAQDSINIITERGDLALASRYRTVRDFYRDDRDKWYIYAGLVYLANLIDAYISAHLYDFDVSDNAAISPLITAPYRRDDGWTLGVRIRW